ncbi:poly A polymerase C-terminal region-like protein [Backusella circina FSU 941]|nr:poly A polymerase C-terminal region-like protein [Backusella circina FSU 941]KAI8891340.1 poly A polymerase C-terminal region-like protein [Backusella circina FSU 941]
MMGYEFATYVNKYLTEQGVPTRSIAKIDSNPEKSKHLETATTKLFDQEVDFCNLRTEVYEEGSRIPSQVTFGTPTEDAYRRDTTINSLFYNVNSHLVEDFTNKGIEDLVQGLIRTPLEPFETFRDDPLRVLRCIRFASRFDFEMVPDLCAAAKHPEIINALIHKISRERVGTEFEKMITGPYPLLSMQLIYAFDLYPVVMAPPQTITEGTVGEPMVAVRAVSIVAWLTEIEGGLRPASDDEKRSLFLAASVLPFYNVMSEQKKKPISAAQLVLRDSLKTNNQDVNIVSTTFKGISLLGPLAESNMNNTVRRSELGMVIRELGALWQTAVKLTAIKELLDTYPAILDFTTWTTKDPNVEVICKKYQHLIQTAEDYGIQECYKWKHVVDGKRAAQILGIRPGPIVMELLKVQMTWQLEHPEGSKEECEEAIKSYWESTQ